MMTTERKKARRVMKKELEFLIDIPEKTALKDTDL